MFTQQVTQLKVVYIQRIVRSQETKDLLKAEYAIVYERGLGMDESFKYIIVFVLNASYFFWPCILHAAHGHVYHCNY